MDTEQRIAALAPRLRRAEDHLEILNLINSHGPLADSGVSNAPADLWIAGGGYNYSGGNSNGIRLEAPDGLIAVYQGAGHQSFFRTGSAHLMATPKITVDGERAHAVGYSFVILREGERWIVFRAAINDYELVRETAGWHIAERVNRTLTGSEESHALMRKVMD